MLRSLIKGWVGEKVTQLGMWAKLDRQVYRRCHDVIVPSSNGTTQIDHVLVSRYGIFVIETKNYKGWIFGDAYAAQWTVSHFGKKFPFQNPLRQNFRHTQCLADYLHLNPAFFHSIVFFIGECEFKTPMPSNVMTEGLTTYVRSFGDLLLSEAEVTTVVASLAGLKGDPRLNKAAHLASLAERHASSSVCPQCGSALVERMARSGVNAGSKFLGCTSYPRCHFTRAIDR
jgi:restriction system protein